MATKAALSMICNFNKPNFVYLNSRVKASIFLSQEFFGFRKSVTNLRSEIIQWESLNSGIGRRLISLKLWPWVVQWIWKVALSSNFLGYWWNYLHNDIAHIRCRLSNPQLYGSRPLFCLHKCIWLNLGWLPILRINVLRCALIRFLFVHRRVGGRFLRRIFKFFLQNKLLVFSDHPFFSVTCPIHNGTL